MVKGIAAKRKLRSVAKALTFFLLLIYLAGAAHLERLHVHNHDSVVTHSEEQEKNPCHRFLYHHEPAHACGHDAHFVVSDKCEMCDLIVHGEQSVLPIIDFPSPVFSLQQFDSYKTILDSYCGVLSSSRAPPTYAYFL